MKKLMIISLFSFLVITITENICATMRWGEITENILVYPGFTESDIIYWAVDSQEYLNGGITVTFPEDIFTQAPYIFVTVQPNTYSPLGILSTQVESVTSSAATVRLNVLTGSSIGEALDNTAKVCVWAIGS